MDAQLSSVLFMRILVATIVRSGISLAHHLSHHKLQKKKEEKEMVMVKFGL